MGGSEGLYPAAMSTHVTITDLQRGEIVKRRGPFETATEARTACAREAGEVLTWHLMGESWEAVSEDRVFQVRRDQVPET